MRSNLNMLMNKRKGITSADCSGRLACSWKSRMVLYKKGIRSSSCAFKASCRSSRKLKITPIIVIR